MPSLGKQCICQICTCGRHMCLHRNKDTHLIIGDDNFAEISGELTEARGKHRRQTKEWKSSDDGHHISPTTDQINAQRVLANAINQDQSLTVDDKGNSQAYVGVSGNSWSVDQVPKRQSIRPPDNLKPGGPSDFTTLHQLEFAQKATSDLSGPSSVHETRISELSQESWNHKQIPKTLPIKKPDSLIFSGPLSLETTNKSDFNENIFQGKASESTRGDTTHRPRTSLKLGGEFQSDSSYQRAFTPKHAENVLKVKKGTSISHLKPEGDMTFDTTSLDYRAALSEQAKRDDQNFVLKPKPAKPQSGLKIPEVPLDDETTAITDYRRWNVSKPERHKPADTLDLGDGITDVDESSSNLTRRVYSDAESKLNDARWHVSRPVVRKPQNNLGSEGNFQFATTNDIDYFSKRSRYSQSNLETLTERSEREQTDGINAETEKSSADIDAPPNEYNIRAYDAEAPTNSDIVKSNDLQAAVYTKAPTPPPNIIEDEQITSHSVGSFEPMKNDTDFGSQNGEQMEYVTWDQIRPKPIRPHSNLRQEGGMEFTTTNRSEYFQKPSERVKGIRPKTSTKVFEGDFDATTMNQIMFSHDQGERVNPIRPKSNLHVENGQFVDETTTAREYQQWEIKRPSPIIHKPSLMQEGSIDFTTTNKTEFEEKHPDKVYPIRPSTTNRISGDIDLTTTNQIMHGSYPIERVQKIVPQSNLRTSSGAFNSETTNRTQFQEYPIDRPKPIRPVSNLHQEGSMDFTTMNQLQFEEKPFEKVSQFRPQTSSKITGDFDGRTMNSIMYGAQPIEKSQMIKPKGSLEVEKGTFSNNTTNKSEFQHWQTAKPQAVTPRNNLQQEGNIDFTTTNQLQYAAKTAEKVSSIRPKTNPKITGQFDGTTTNQMMYQNIPGEKPKAVRPKTNLHVEKGNFRGETTNNKEFQNWGYEKPSPIKPHSSIRQEGTMDFTTTNNLQFEGKTTERALQIRPTTTTKITGDFEGTTMNQIMFQNNPVEKVKGIRPSTTIHLESGKFEDQTTARREYQQWVIDRPDPIKHVGSLTQEGEMDFTTSNQTEFGEKPISKPGQIRPHTTSPITGDFDGTTTNQIMYQAQPIEKVHDIRPRDNLTVETGEFRGETTTSKEYGIKTGNRPEAIKPKPNLTQDGDFNFITSNQEQFEEKAIDKVSSTRPKTHTKISEGKFYGTTMNQTMFQTPAMETVHAIRPQTNIRIEDGAFQGNTTVTDAYQQWKTERPKAFQLASSLKQEGEMNFETTNKSEFREKGFDRVQQIRPKTTSKIEGDFEATTTNQAMFHQPEKVDRVKPIKHQNNLHLEEGKFSGETTTNREYRQWVKNENKITVPKKKLQAAGVRTQRDIPNRRKEISKKSTKDVGSISVDLQRKDWKNTSPPQDVASNNVYTMEGESSSMQADVANEEASTSMTREKREDLSATKAAVEKGMQSEAKPNLKTDKDPDLKDISTMMADYGAKQSTKTKSIRPKGNLTQEGDMNFTTTQAHDYKKQIVGDGDRTRKTKSEGTTKESDSFKNANYQNSESWQLDEYRESKLNEKEAELNKTNDYKEQTVMTGDQKIKTKSEETMKESTSFKETNDQNYESWQLADHLESKLNDKEAGSNKTKKTEYRSNVRQSQEMNKKHISQNEMLMKPVKRYKPNDNLKVEHVPFDATSTTRTEFKKWEGRRSSSKRRGEHLRQEGKMEFDTTSNDYSVTRDYQLSREVTRPKIKDELKKGSLTPTGSMEFSTTSKSSYVGGATVARAKNLRPRSSLRFGVSDSNTQDVLPSSRSNPEISTTRKNHELTSTSRASYVGYTTGRRTRANRPSTSQKVGEGAFEGQSTTRSSFTMPRETVVKSKSIKPENHNILDGSKDFSGDTTYKSSFEPVKGHCPVLDLEAGRLPMTFNEEKNGHMFYAPRVQG